MTGPSRSTYAEDLAYIHHAGFTELADRGGEQLLSLLESRGIDSGRVVDLGCGSGVWAARLAASGYEVLGIDSSPAMLEIARAEAPAAELRCGSVFDADLPTCGAVTALGEVIGYYGEEAPSDSAIAELFERIANALVEGGIFAFDVLVVEGREPMSYRNFRTGEDWAVLFEVEESSDRSELRRDQTLFRKVGEDYRRSRELHRVRVFEPERVEALLVAAGFEVSVGPAYGSYRLAPRRLAFIATKRLQSG